MSLVGAALPVAILEPADRSHAEQTWYHGNAAWPPPLASVRGIPAREPLMSIESFRTPWWPNGGVLVADGGLSDVLDSPAYDDVYPVAGANGRLGFVGYSRDQYGSPLPGCTMRLFRTSTGELVAQVTSDPSTAFYTVTTPYLDAHFITCHAATPVPSAGATVDSLIPG